jgi:hypothetical protein
VIKKNASLFFRRKENGSKEMKRESHLNSSIAFLREQKSGVLSS